MSHEKDTMVFRKMKKTPYCVDVASELNISCSIELVSCLNFLRQRLTFVCKCAMQLNVIYSLLTGRLVREKVDPAVQRVVRSQVG